MIFVFEMSDSEPFAAEVEMGSIGSEEMCGFISLAAFAELFVKFAESYIVLVL